MEHKTNESGILLPETERLRFREYSENDFEKLRTILSDPETMRFYPSPYDDNGVRRWINWNLDNYADLGFGLWVIERKEDGAFLGDCGITMQIIQKKIVPEIGYHVHKDYWRMGYATEAARACKAWIFSHTSFRTVYSYMNSENIGSRRVAEKNGMTLIGAYRENEESLCVYAIQREELKN